MKTESFHEELPISELIIVETYCAPVCTLAPGTPSSTPGCSSRPLLYPGSIYATAGKVPFCRSARNWSTGTILLGYLAAVAKKFNALSCAGGTAKVKSVTYTFQLTPAAWSRSKIVWFGNGGEPGVGGYTYPAEVPASRNSRLG